MYPHAGNGLLMAQGHYLLGLVVYFWCGGFLLWLLVWVIGCLKLKYYVCKVSGYTASFFKSFSVIHRIEKGNQKDLLYIQFII